MDTEQHPARPTFGGSGRSWSSPQAWERAKSPENCPICLDGGPHNTLVSMRAGDAAAGPSAPIPGYACLVAKRHVVEPFELPPNELAQFWQEAMIVGKALHGLFESPKINYEIHGNTMPHLHLHIYPRYADDPYVGQAIDWHAKFQRTPEEIIAIGTAIQREWEAAGGHRPSGPDRNEG